MYDKETIKRFVRNEERLKEAEAILKDFLTTNEDRATWIEEMSGTIEAFLEEGKDE